MRLHGLSCMAQPAGTVLRHTTLGVSYLLGAQDDNAWPTGLAFCPREHCLYVNTYQVSQAAVTQIISTWRWQCMQDAWDEPQRFLHHAVALHERMQTTLRSSRLHMPCMLRLNIADASGQGRLINRLHGVTLKRIDLHRLDQWSEEPEGIAFNRHSMYIIRCAWPTGHGGIAQAPYCCWTNSSAAGSLALTWVPVHSCTVACGH